MSVVKLNTAQPATSGGTNWIMWLALGGAAAFLAYKFWWLPKKEKEEKESSADGSGSESEG
jgi:hypothetical protein